MHNHPGWQGGFPDVVLYILDFRGRGPQPELWSLMSTHTLRVPGSILEMQLQRATCSPKPSTPTSLIPQGLLTPPQNSILFYLPWKEYHSICLYWSTLDCRQYQNSGFGTANNQQQHELKMRENISY